MESVASNSSPPENHHHHHPLFKPIQPAEDRIVWAIRHRLRLLHRTESTLFILGATGNVYTVILSATPSCTCPDRLTPCKHILFVFIRVLGVSPDDVCLRRRNLLPCQLNRLLGMPTLAEAVAGASHRQRFQQLLFHSKQGCLRPFVEMEDGTSCPICLEEMGKEERVVACGTCRNPIHEGCLVRWKRSRGRRSASCVICRARWRDSHRTEQNKYLNLAP
ncbi:Mitogen-activated protein kinase kinase kinase 1 [Quillaja saponaria]|uniref:Mitogen-activated protein kinase kinase kinase 1 n=1 Tax=Quillaja saponaria TaxID=32244 RepID=A0AAD7LIJ3_QUISA|nr:Mitogen-activated protein kinase kinase kinase 1 [Quillaja saponaria]